MANLSYALLPTEVLVVNPVPGNQVQKRVEFSPAEVRQAVEAGAILAKEMEKKNPEDTQSESKCLHI